MADYETIPPETAARMIAAGECYVVDVRSPAEFQAHRVAGAHLLPMGELQERHAEIPREPDRKILIVCEHGVRSQRTCAALAEHGWTKLMNMQGGMAHWIECGLPVASGTQADAENLRPAL